MGNRSRGRFATPACFPLHDGTSYRELRARRCDLGFVHRSRANFCRAASNPNRYDSHLVAASVCAAGDERVQGVPRVALHGAGAVAGRHGELQAPTPHDGQAPRRAHHLYKPACSQGRSTTVSRSDTTLLTFASNRRGRIRVRCFPNPLSPTPLPCGAGGHREERDQGPGGGGGRRREPPAWRRLHSHHQVSVQAVTGELKGLGRTRGTARKRMILLSTPSPARAAAAELVDQRLFAHTARHSPRSLDDTPSECAASDGGYTDTAARELAGCTSLPPLLHPPMLFITHWMGPAD